MTMEQTLLDYYQAIEESSRKMLDAARQRDWDSVIRYEGSCAVLIEQLRFRAKSEALDPVSRREKVHIMQRILKNDAQIRYLAEPWLSHLEQNAEGQHFLH
jgi:flagellar protein FliT